MKTKIFLLIGLLYSFSSFSQIVQKKYPGLAGKPADYIVITNETSKIVPFHHYDSFLSQQVGIANKPANHVVLNGTDQVTTYPYLVVPDSEYTSYLKKNVGFAEKPANHISVKGKETIVLKSSEVNTNLSLYPGIATKPANHVVIDGQEVVFVEKEKYRGFIAQYPGVPELPANYVYMDKQLVLVIPINPEDVADVYSEPIPSEIHDGSRGKIKEVPRNYDGGQEKREGSRTKTI